MIRHVVVSFPAAPPTNQRRLKKMARAWRRWSTSRKWIVVETIRQDGRPHTHIFLAP